MKPEIPPPESDTSSFDLRLFGILLTPSWLSGITCITTGLLVGVGTVALARYQGSSAQFDFLNYHIGQGTSAYQSVHNGLLSNAFVSNLPLLLFWVLVGVVIYLFVIKIFDALRSGAEMTDELEYVHVDRRKLIRTAGLHFIIRLVVLAIFLAYLVVFFHRVVPYCIALALAGSAQLTTVTGIGYVLLSVVVMALAVHLIAILLRLLLLRPRLFSNALYVD